MLLAVDSGTQSYNPRLSNLAYLDSDPNVFNSDANQALINRGIKLTMDIMDTIKDQIESNPVIVYMKGSPDQPQCGFSARTIEALMGCGKRFAFVDILANPDIRSNLPKYANWPTFPQLWVKGELVGGCDIVTEMFENGELLPMITAAVPDEAPKADA